MNKFLAVLAVVLLGSVNAYAEIDLVSATQNAQDKIDAANAAVASSQDASAQNAAAVQEAVKAKVEEAKQELSAKQAAATDATAEKKSGLLDSVNTVKDDVTKTKNDVNALQNAFSN